MGRLFDNKKKKVPLHRWLGLRPVDFVRAAERRAAVLLRQLSEQRRGKHNRAQRHYPLSAIRYPLSLP
ncbi:MAG: hypothetical protein WBO04_06700 [Steroidobacteraceae bacterium]